MKYIGEFDELRAIPVKIDDKHLKKLRIGIGNFSKAVFFNFIQK
jgi:hypothetical protein